MNSPLVTCLCLTKNRREWLPIAIDCFRRQTYENRELLVVADGVFIFDLVPEDPRITVLERGGPVGAKRNAGCDAARGDIIAVWDDDDYSAPQRIGSQVAAMRENGKAVAGYAAMKFTDASPENRRIAPSGAPARWWLYTGTTLGTSLCFTRDWWMRHRFKEINCGQDEQFATEALGAKQLVREGDLDLMYATNHPGNASAMQKGGSRQAEGHNYKFLRDFVWADGQLDAVGIGATA
jgi:glycosyltransferase involved in cell wall biosynthesis